MKKRSILKPRKFQPGSFREAFERAGLDIGKTDTTFAVTIEYMLDGTIRYSNVRELP